MRTHHNLMAVHLPGRLVQIMEPSVTAKIICRYGLRVESVGSYLVASLGLSLIVPSLYLHCTSPPSHQLMALPPPCPPRPWRVHQALRRHGNPQEQGQRGSPYCRLGRFECPCHLEGSYCVYSTRMMSPSYGLSRSHDVSLIRPVSLP